MRVFGILLTAAYVAYFIPMEAHNQQKLTVTQKLEKKIYVNPQNLQLKNDGIFWQVSQDKWIPISGIDHDSQGIYLTGSRVIRWSYFVCSSCGRNYSSRPSECANPDCRGTDFYEEYEDIWDRS